MARVGTRRRGRPNGPSLWTLAAGLVVIAVASFTGATRVGGEVGRLERAERLSFLVEARAYEQAALDSRTAASGVPGDEAAGRRAAAVRQELTAALAELAAVVPDDPAVARVLAAAVEWQAAVDTKLQLLAAGDLVAANRFDRARAGPAFDRLAGLLRTTAASYSAAAAAAQGRSKAGTLAVVVAATLLSLVLLWRVERPGRGSAPPRPGPRRTAPAWSTRSSRWPSTSAAAWRPSSTTGPSRPDQARAGRAGRRHLDGVVPAGGGHGPDRDPPESPGGGMTAAGTAPRARTARRRSSWPPGPAPTWSSWTCACR